MTENYYLSASEVLQMLIRVRYYSELNVPLREKEEAEKIKLELVKEVKNYIENLLADKEENGYPTIIYVKCYPFKIHCCQLDKPFISYKDLVENIELLIRKKYPEKSSQRRWADIAWFNILMKMRDMEILEISADRIEKKDPLVVGEVFKQTDEFVTHREYQLDGEKS